MRGGTLGAGLMTSLIQSGRGHEQFHAFWAGWQRERLAGDRIVIGELGRVGASDAAEIAPDQYIFDVPGYNRFGFSSGHGPYLLSRMPRRRQDGRIEAALTCSHGTAGDVTRA
jgi:hypothetical protein